MHPSLPAALVLLVLAAPAQAVTVAILDTGIDADHPQLTGRVSRVSFVTYGPGLPQPPIGPGIDPGQLEDDPDGHGTAAASVVGGSGIGIAPDADLLDMQVDGEYTQGLADPAAEAAAIEALDFLLRGDGQAEVVLLSFAANPISPEGAGTLAAQAASLREEGIPVVVPGAQASSALHESRSVFTVVMDASCGSPEAPASKPDLAAPGDGIEVAVPGNAAQPGGTTRASGPHLAAAHAAGALSRMLDARPDLPVDAAFAILRDTATDTDPAGPDSCTGAGVIDIDAAVAAAEAWSDPAVAPTPQTEDTPMPLPFVVAGLVGIVVALARRR